ncbi:MAG: hypothetical protein DME22_11270 [Verrucomicrobia bacterium]|nr:MAG: hypothetical protein DME22_11270 [Verrucomicrobiota bacterium]PYK00301.1 MAG: hypothetical protein DME23_07570 [Verrucomicrobiota bacterium]
MQSPRGWSAGRRLLHASRVRSPELSDPLVSRFLSYQEGHNAFSAVLSKNLKESALLDCGFGSMKIVEVP